MTRLVPVLLISKDASDDLHDIILQTVSMFGVRQAQKTNDVFIQAMESLAQMPGMGHHRADLDPEGKQFLYWTVLRRFVVIYVPVMDGIRVARIIDGTRELQSILTDNAGDD